MLNFRQIEIFAAIMQTGSATAAARMLHVSQASVSKMLFLLERQLDTQLFVRGHGRLQPSEQGEILYEDVKKVLEGLRAVERTSADLSGQRGGRIRIASTFSLAQTAVAGAVVNLTKRFKTARFLIQTTSTRDVVRMLLEGEADLGVLFDTDEHVYLTHRTLCDTELFCLFPPGHPLAAKKTISPADLAPYKIVGGSRGTVFGAALAEVFLECGCPLDFTIEVNSAQVAATLAAAGVGVALSDPFVAQRMRSELVSRPFVPSVSINPKAVHRSDFILGHLHEAFISELSAILNAASRAA